MLPLHRQPETTRLSSQQVGNPLGTTVFVTVAVTEFVIIPAAKWVVTVLVVVGMTVTMVEAYLHSVCVGMVELVCDVDVV